MASSNFWLWVFRAGVGFLLLSSLLFLLGFATDFWHDDDVTNYGLWQTCNGAECTAHNADELPVYHVATQAFQILTLACYSFSPILHLIFYCKKKRKDTDCKSRILDIGYLIGVLFHVCSVVVFGLGNSTPEDFAWSFEMSCAASAVAFIGTILIMVSRNKAMYNFSFRAVKRSTRKTHITTSSTTADGRQAAPPMPSPVRPSVESTPVLGETPACKPAEPVTNINIAINVNGKLSEGGDNNMSNGVCVNTDNPFPLYHPTHSHTHKTSPNSLSENYLPSSGFTLDVNNQPYTPAHPMTQVRSAPRSSISENTSPSHKNVFGPADRKRSFEMTNNAALSPSTPLNLNSFPVPTLPPSAPPYEEVHKADNPPPYAEAVSETRSPGEAYKK